MTEKKSAIVVICSAVLLVAIFAAILICSLASIGAEAGEPRSTRSSPTGLASAGAPRSQLALKQMFDSMGAVRTNGNRVVYEPITDEYLSAIAERKAEGETPMLSVEEILYIISDSAACLERYDGVKLGSEGTVSFKVIGGDRPDHLAHLENSRAIYTVIVYRIKSLCHEGAFEYGGDRLIYYPDGAGGRGRERKFVFTPVSDDCRSENIVYYPGDGQRIPLYPSTDAAKYDLRYMLQSDEPLGETERGILAAAGYNPDRCRNITPSYWSGITECRLVVVSGRIVVVDPIVGRAIDSAPEGMRTVSIAAGDWDGDKKYELYFTAYSENGGVAVKYDPLIGETEILMSRDFCMGVYEDLDTKAVSFYRTELIESGSYLNLLRRVGDKIRE